MSQVDLHTHTTASDGTLEPAELVRKAASLGLRAVAVTDHDTVGGLSQALQAGRETGVEVIPGCELSIDFPSGQMHILGLFLPDPPTGLRATLQDLQDRRNSRNDRILAKLREAGVDVDLEEIRELAGEASIGRPHIARVLVQKGVVESIDQAFREYIGPGGAAYVPKDKLDPEKAIRILKQEGATVILAHPYSLEIDTEELRELLGRLKEQGLDGVEAYYTDHTPEQTRTYLQLCREFDLLVSGGSDFHGSVKVDVQLGAGRGNLDLPYSLVRRMREARGEKPAF
ncbi:MAG: PHP domain-containing protein [Desulfohalobiaceae bacterium]|nr:PHP domain-containing protein [Desulfohalobiaceae bacterium]